MRVFVLGAGASVSCGLPLTNELLPSVLPKVDKATTRRQILDFIKYLYPHFNSKWGNYPNLEELLSLLDVYLEFSPIVKRRHRFSTRQVRKLRMELLRAISIYLYEQVARIDIEQTTLFRLVRLLRRGDVVITFNWDFTVELALEALGWIKRMSYTLDREKISLLKPHGSIDWFDSEKIRLKKDLTFDLIPEIGRIHVFTYFRFPRVEKRIVPVIIPPIVKKKFEHEEFQDIWRDTWKALRGAHEVYIIGFSLPPEDLHIKFVMRSAFRANEGNRTEPLPITLVNPDRGVFLRFERLVASPMKYFESRLEGILPERLLMQG